jgi:hypothetical protein
MKSPFCLAVEDAFGFLQQVHGFQLIERGRASVVYATAVVELSFFHDDQRSFEVSLSVRLRGEVAQSFFSFDEILSSLKVPACERPVGYSADTIKAVQRLLQEMAEIMKRYAGFLLEGDPESWRVLVEQRRTDCIAYAAAVSLAQAKQVADAAWALRDYPKVVVALEAVEALLGKSDASRLAYARRVVSR